jgi:alpha-L-fucosidase 2
MMLRQRGESYPRTRTQTGSVRLAARVVFGIWAGLGLAKWCLAAPLSQSFNAHTGTMDVNYARYLSKHDVVFNHPITKPVHGSTVGNGRVGVMVWNEDGLKLQISGVDASEQTAFSAGLIHLHTTPGMDTSYSTFQQRLSLYDGVLTAKYDADRTVTVLGSPDSEVIGIHVSDTRPGVSLVSLDLSIWDVSKLDGGDIRDIGTWRSIATYADAKGIGLSRGQKDPNNFGYTLAARVQGAEFATRSIDADTIRLVITPSPSYTIWVACASRLNAPNHDSVLRASSLLSEVESRGYDATLVDYENWWHEFWQKSFVQYSNSAGDGDYLENLYYLYTYIVAAGSYANYPFHFINGAFTAAGDVNSTKWSVAYWYWNQRNVYGSFLASNHPAVLHVLNHLYSRNIAALEAHTLEKFGIGVIWVPETMRWDGNARNAESSDWTRDILSTGTEAAENMYAEYEYTNDAVYLRTAVYPFMKAVAQFYVNVLACDPETGKFYVAKSNAHETYWGVRNAITDLAAIRSLFPPTIRASEQLGVDVEMRSRWRMVLDNLANYPLAEDNSRYAPHDPPAAKSHNGENITSELIWPYGVTGIGAPDYQLALNGWINRPYPYGNIWSSDAVQAARLGLGEEALTGMKLMIWTYQSYPNGLTNDTNGRFEYLGSHLSAINESLLQSYNGKIRVFPAVPGNPDFVGRFTLLAKGGFLVSSEYEGGDIKYVAIKSLYGNSVTIVNPWGGERTRARRAIDATAVLTTTKPEFTFDTRADTVYIIERTARPFGTYPHHRLSGKTNNDVKRLTGSPATLGADSTGSDSGAPPRSQPGR